MTHIAAALGISRPHLSTTLNHPTKPKAPMLSGKDEALLARIRPIVDARPTCGYRRVTAHLNRDEKGD